MKDQYTDDRRDPVIKQIERQGLIELAASVGAPLEVLRELYPERVRPFQELVRQRRRRSRLASGVMLAMLLSQTPASAFTKKDFYDAARRWERGSFCQRLYRSGWETVSFFLGC